VESTVGLAVVINLGYRAGTGLEKVFQAGDDCLASLKPATVQHKLWRRTVKPPHTYLQAREEYVLCTVLQCLDHRHSIGLGGNAGIDLHQTPTT
jgi:hypothetical protein